MCLVYQLSIIYLILDLIHLTVKIFIFDANHHAFRKSCWRLDHAVHHRGQDQGHQIDPLLLPGRTGLRWRFRLSIPLIHQLTNPRDDPATQQAFCTICPNDVKSHMLRHKLHSGTFETKVRQRGLVRVAFVPCDRILAKQVGFNISGKVEVMALNTTNSPVQVENEDLQKNSPEKCEL